MGVRTSCPVLADLTPRNKRQHSPVIFGANETGGWVLGKHKLPVLNGVCTTTFQPVRFAEQLHFETALKTRTAVDNRMLSK